MALEISPNYVKELVFRGQRPMSVVENIVRKAQRSIFVAPPYKFFGTFPNYTGMASLGRVDSVGELLQPVAFNFDSAELDAVQEGFNTQGMTNVTLDAANRSFTFDVRPSVSKVFPKLQFYAEAGATYLVTCSTVYVSGTAPSAGQFAVVRGTTTNVTEAQPFNSPVRQQGIPVPVPYRWNTSGVKAVDLGVAIEYTPAAAVIWRTTVSVQRLLGDTLLQHTKGYNIDSGIPIQGVALGGFNTLPATAAAYDWFISACVVLPNIPTSDNFPSSYVGLVAQLRLSSLRFVSLQFTPQYRGSTTKEVSVDCQLQHVPDGEGNNTVGIGNYTYHVSEFSKRRLCLAVYKKGNSIKAYINAQLSATIDVTGKAYTFDGNVSGACVQLGRLGSESGFGGLYPPHAYNGLAIMHGDLPDETELLEVIRIMTRSQRADLL